MKKIALVVALGLTLASAGNAAYVLQMNDANGSDSTFFAKLKLERKTEVEVKNNANVAIIENSTNTTGFDVWAGGDVENSTFASGAVDQYLESDVSVNDTAVILNDCGCDGEEPAPAPEYIKQTNGDDDSVLAAEVEVEDKTEAEVENELNFVEVTNSANTTQSVLDVNDDIENSALTTGGTKTVIKRGRSLNRSTVLKNIPVDAIMF